jgi:hypothetical protein
MQDLRGAAIVAASFNLGPGASLMDVIEKAAALMSMAEAHLPAPEPEGVVQGTPFAQTPITPNDLALVRDEDMLARVREQAEERHASRHDAKLDAARALAAEDIEGDAEPAYTAPRKERDDG